MTTDPMPADPFTPGVTNWMEWNAVLPQRWAAAVDKASSTPDGDHQAGRFRNAAMQFLFDFALELCEMSPAFSGRGWLLFDGAIGNITDDAALLDRIALDVQQVSHRNLHHCRYTALRIMAEQQAVAANEQEEDVSASRPFPADDIKAIAEGRLTTEDVADRWLNDR